MNQASLRLNKIRRQHPAIHKFAQARLELDKQNAAHIDNQMRQHIEHVTALAKRLNPEIDSDKFRAKQDYTEKRLFWQRIERGEATESASPAY